MLDIEPGLIRQMNAANPLWGAPRIHGELLKLGITVSQATVTRYMLHRAGAPSSWRVEGRLREDLYYRLNGLLIQLPSLRERIDDLPLLIDYFIAQANRDHHRRIEGMDDKCRQALGSIDGLATFVSCIT